MKKVTQKARFEMARSAIDATPLGCHFDMVSLAILNEACGTQWPDAKHMENPDHPTDPRHVHVLDVDGWRSWSWVKAIRPRKQTAIVKEAMRAEIEEDIKDFAAIAYDHPCAWAHKGDCSGPMQTDHADMAFDDIANEFIAINPEIELHEIGIGSAKRIKDPDIAAAWITFHAQRAVYQRMCRRHNASKGKKGEA